MSSKEYVFLTLLLCLAFVYSRKAFAFADALDRRSTFVDSLGLALFSLTGVRYALEAGLPPLPAALMGVVTGTFGGVLRDVLVRESPGDLPARAALRRGVVPGLPRRPRGAVARDPAVDRRRRGLRDDRPPPDGLRPPRPPPSRPALGREGGEAGRQPTS